MRNVPLCSCDEYSITKKEFVKFEKISIYEHICKFCGKHRCYSAMGRIPTQLQGQHGVCDNISQELEKLIPKQHSYVDEVTGEAIRRLGFDKWDSDMIMVYALPNHRGPSPEYSLPVGVLVSETVEYTPTEVLEKYIFDRLHNFGQMTDNSGLSEMSRAMNKDIVRKK